MSDTNEGLCPLCAVKPLFIKPAIILHDEQVECAKCGYFSVALLLRRTTLKGKESAPETAALLPYVSAHTRQASDRGERIALTAENWMEFALLHATTPVATKLDKLLDLLASRSRPGQAASLKDDTDPPLLDAFDKNELLFLAQTLRDSGLVNHPQGWNFALTAKGWERLQAGRSSGIKGRCFVAMSFHDSMKDAYNSGIFQAVKSDSKMDPIRLDFVQHNEKICDKIVAEIRTCQFVVADVTLASQNVYFEAGFAMALNRPVIWTCDDARFEQDVRFDTRQYPYIRWKTADDLRKQLADRIKATIPGAV